MIPRRSPHLLVAVLTIGLTAKFLLADEAAPSADAPRKADATNAADPAVPAVANQPEKEKVPSRLKAAMLKRYDANANGKVDEDESDKFLADRKQRAGANAPGNAGNAGNAGPAAEALRQRVLKQFDKDGDGKLNAEERAAAEKARAERGREKGDGDRGAMLKQLDKDGDGKLSEEERQAGREQARRKLQQALGGEGANLQELIKRFDKDGDGQLSEEERQAARRAFQDRAGRKGKKND